MLNGFEDLQGARAVLEDGMRLPVNQYRGPRFLITTNDLWLVNYYQGNFRDALSCLVELPGENANGSFARWLRKGQTYVALNQHASATASFDSALAFAERLPAGFRKHTNTGIGLAWRGEHKKASLELESAGKFDLSWSQRRVLEESQAISVVLAGDTDRALSLLEKLIPQSGILTVWNLRLDPVYNPLRNNPRFKALLTKYANR